MQKKRDCLLYLYGSYATGRAIKFWSRSCVSTVVTTPYPLSRRRPDTVPYPVPYPVPIRNDHVCLQKCYLATMWGLTYHIWDRNAEYLLYLSRSHVEFYKLVTLWSSLFARTERAGYETTARQTTVVNNGTLIVRKWIPPEESWTRDSCIVLDLLNHNR